MKPLLIDPLARAELDDAVEVYEQQRPGRGNRFREAVEFAIARIQQSPKAFAIYKRTIFRECIVRQFPYAIYFLERDHAILIGAVVHGRRRSDNWLRRFRKR